MDGRPLPFSVLAIDVGNTQTVFGLFRSDDASGPVPGAVPIRTERQPTVPLRDPAGWTVVLTAFLGAGSNPPRPLAVAVTVLSSVVPAATPSLAAACLQLTGRDPILVTPATCGLVLAIDRPDQVGADRLACIAAVVGGFPVPAVVVDLGTATTFSVADARGRFIGGAICPGLATSANALHQAAAQLPRVDPADIPLDGLPALGRTTEGCIRSGLVLGTASLIEGMTRRFEAELGSPATLVVTGGWSRLVAPHLARPYRLDPDLLLKGLHAISGRAIEQGGMNAP